MFRSTREQAAAGVAGQRRREESMKSSSLLTKHRHILIAAIAPIVLAPAARAWDTSPAAILQVFEDRYSTIENRLPDIFKAGYGMVQTPPPGRADQGSFSVGYDQYDRFDLGYTNNATLYGTETGIKQLVKNTHAAGLDFGVDFVLNHNGYSGTGNAASRAGFQGAGAYPGMALYLQNTDPAAPGYNTKAYNDADGDFNSAYSYGDLNERLAGLIDINHGKNFQFYRSPVTANDPNNIPMGTVAWSGRIANVPDANNKRFYPDTGGSYISVYDPKTGESNIRIYNFNTAAPMSGDAVQENVTGYLMRNAQWLVQVIGVDAFRLDATKHIEGFSLDYFDRSVYRQSQRTLLDGSQRMIYSYGEMYDGSWAALQPYVRKDINPAQPGVVGGNRDTLDFPLFFAMRDNLTGNGLQNSWYNIRNASFDMNDDNLHNGSQAVKFVSSHDNDGAYLSNVAYAYTLMLPGQAIVYYNGSEFGTARNTFPRPGRGDALGGAYGDSLTKLVDIRNRYGNGNYIERWVEKEIFAYEREATSLVLLSNRLDSGYDARTLNVNLGVGTYLEELTGNAAKTNGDIPEVVQVLNGGVVNVRFVRNGTLGSLGSNNGYLIYGLPAPRGSLTLTGSTQTLAGTTPVLTGTDDNKAYVNATTRVSDIKVLSGNTFTITLNTQRRDLLGNPLMHDFDADGDNALIKIDEGFDANGNGHVDYTSPGNAAYAFEEFTGTHTPGYNSTATNYGGTYAQTVNIAGLSEGYHYLTVRAFRHRADGGPAVYSDFKETLYVDRLKPVSSFNTFKSFGTTGDNDVWIQSDDMTANSVKMFLNLPATATDAQILAMVGAGQGNSDQLDRNIFKTYFQGMPNGNNVLTVVTYEITGNYNIQRIVGKTPSNGRGKGIGDLDFNGTIDSSDLRGTSWGFEAVLYGNNATFNPAADANGDGLVDNNDFAGLKTAMFTAGVTDGTRQTYTDVYNTRFDTNSSWNVNADGNWTTLSKWTTVGPNSNRATANFTGAITSPRTVTLDQIQTVKSLNFSNANKYTLAGANTLYIDSATTTSISDTQGSHDITAPLSLQKPVSINVTNAADTLKATNLQDSGVAITKVGNGTLEVNRLRTTGAVSINAGTVKITPAGGAAAVSRMNSLTIGASGKLDIGNNALVIPAGSLINGSAISVTRLRNLLLAGRGGAGTGLGTWDAPGGIGTSSFHDDGTDAIGYVWNADPNLLAGQVSTVNGYSVSGSDYIVKYTACGDADLNGLVDDTDVAVIGLTYDGGASGGHHWYEGDFNYDGKVDDDDVAILGLTYNPTGTPLTPSFYEALSETYGQSFASAFSSGANVVPEPGSIAMLAVGAVGLLRRRRK